MSWLTHHRASEELAGAAQVARWKGDVAAAQSQSLAAARAEASALAELGEEDPEQYGILAVSAAALYFKGDALEDAEKTAREALSRSDLPASYRYQLREIVWAVRWKRLKSAFSSEKLERPSSSCFSLHRATAFADLLYLMVLSLTSLATLRMPDSQPLMAIGYALLALNSVVLFRRR